MASCVAQPCGAPLRAGLHAPLRERPLSTGSDYEDMCLSGPLDSHRSSWEEVCATIRERREAKEKAVQAEKIASGARPGSLPPSRRPLAEARRLRAEADERRRRATPRWRQELVKKKQMLKSTTSRAPLPSTLPAPPRKLNMLLQKRVARVSTAHLYLLNQTGPNAFLVGGDGRLQRYRVTIGPQQCSCRHDSCIHLLFVMIRVLKVPPTDLRLEASTLQNFEVEQLVSNFHESRAQTVSSLRRPRDLDVRGDCPICLREMLAGDNLIECVDGCHNQLHRHCMSVWADERQSKDQDVHCPLCRGPWSMSTLEGPAEAHIQCESAHTQAPFEDISLPHHVVIPTAMVPLTRPWCHLFGEQLVSCLFSRDWTIREAALHKLVVVLVDMLSEAAPHHPPATLSAAMGMIAATCTDPVFKVYDASLSVIPVLTPQRPEELMEALGPIFPEVFERCGNSNKRVRDRSFAAILDIIGRVDGGVAQILARMSENQEECDDASRWSFRWWLGRLAVIQRLFEEHPAEFQRPQNIRALRRRSLSSAALEAATPAAVDPPASPSSGPLETSLEFCEPALEHTHQRVRKQALAVMQLLREHLQPAVPAATAPEAPPPETHEWSSPLCKPLSELSEVDETTACQPGLVEVLLAAETAAGSSLEVLVEEEAKEEAEAMAIDVAVPPGPSSHLPHGVESVDGPLRCGPAGLAMECADCLLTATHCAAAAAHRPGAGGDGRLRPGDIETGPRVSPGTLPVAIDASYKEGVAWRKGGLLGTGAFSSCYAAQDMKTGTLMAVKQICFCLNTHEDEAKMLQQISREVKVLRDVGAHPNVVQYLGAVPEENHFNLFMEHMSGGSIASILHRFGPMQRNVVRRYTAQILAGLDHLHRQGILHRDLKGANLLVGEGGKQVKLCDFGAACQQAKLKTVTGEFLSTRGTPAWMPPEVIRGEKYGRNSDIWSLGCCVIEMASAAAPWAEAGLTNPYALMFMIASGKSQPAIPEELGTEGCDFVQRCLVVDPAERACTGELLRHPFVQGL